MLIHGPYLVKSVFIALLEPLELVLELLELLSELLIVISELDVISLVLLALPLELLFDSSEYILISSLLGLETGDCVIVDLFSLFEDLEVELKLLLIESVHALHIFHALLEDLHLLLKLDLLLSLIIGVLRAELLELLRVGFFVIGTLVLEVLLQLLVLLEEVLDLVLVTLEDLAALVIERFLDVVQLV